VRRIAIPPRLDAAIRAAIQPYPAGQLSALVQDSMDAAGRRPLAIKYVPVRWAKTYAVAGAQLKVSTTPGFTWGTGTYVAPTAFPSSTAIYGRIGVVAEFDPFGWQVLDATTPHVQALYLDWIRFQPLYRALALTMHSSLANRYLRDLFRTMYGIDCVLFRPDQRNLLYTGATDVWMNVTDWTGPAHAREIDSTYSRRLANPRLIVLAEEEFEAIWNDVGRQTMIGPLTPRVANATMQQRIAAAYASASRTPVRLDA
jgi:hypothetical protein